MAEVGMFGLSNAAGEESVPVDGAAGLEDIIADDANPGGPGFP